MAHDGSNLKELKSTLTYKMNAKAYRLLMKRCKNMTEFKEELLRGLSLPYNIKEITSEVAKSTKVAIYTSYADEFVDIQVERF